MNGQDNLIPFNERTEEERREIAKKAGKASGKVRREKKLFREALISALKSTDKTTGNKVGVDLALAILNKAMDKKHSSVAQWEFIRDSIDGKPEETVNVNNNHKLEDFFSDE